jgi:hypothetical protein
VKRTVMILTVALVMAAMLVAMAAPAFADHTAHDFCGSGNEFAQGHVVVMATNESPGLTGPPPEHVVGSHQGFAVCDPAGHI